MMLALEFDGSDCVIKELLLFVRYCVAVKTDHGSVGIISGTSVEHHNLKKSSS